MKTFSTEPSVKEGSKFISCPICQGTRFKKEWGDLKESWVKCQDCSLLFQNPQPLEKDILNRYAMDYAQYEAENGENFLKLMHLGLNDINFNSLEPLDGGKKNFLDIGCATGLLIRDLTQKGWEAEGLEVCREAASYGERQFGVPIFKGLLHEASFKENSFFIIHNSHVIEHINDPYNFVTKIYSLLRPGGYYICATPNSASLQRKLYKSQWRSVIPDHLCLFSKSTLETLAKRAGFKTIKHKTWGGIGLGFAPPFIKKILDKSVKPLGIGDVMIYLFQKPL